MFLPASTPQPANGTTPIDSRMVLRDMIYQQNLANGVGAAYAAVYGNCTPAGSYAAAGVNLMSDIAQAPVPSAVIASQVGASSLISSGEPDMTDTPVTTVPLNGGSSPSYPIPTPYNLTTNQGMAVPVVPANTPIPQRPVQTCPANTTRRRRNWVRPSSGLAPGWGDAFAQQALPQSSNGLLCWIQQNPLWALGAAVLGVVVLSSGGEGK